MKTLDRYIIRQFLINYAILFVVLMTLFVVVDLLVDLDEFLQAGMERSDQFGGRWLGTLYTIADYYGPLVFLLYVFFSGLLVVGATGFTMSGFTRNRELLAMITGGVSMYRIAAPVVVVGSLLNFLVLPDQELVIPEFASKLVRRKSEVGYEAIKNFPIRFAPDSAGNLFSASEFDASSGGGMLQDVTILIRDNEALGVQRVTAGQAFWVAPEEVREVEGHRVVGPGWELVSGNVISKSMEESLSEVGTNREVQMAAFMASDLSPMVLLAQRAKHYPRFLSLHEIRSLAGNERVRRHPDQVNRLWQIMHSRFSMFVVSVLLQLIGLPFFMQREPGNMLVQGMKAVGVCVLVWGLGLVMLEMGAAYLPPASAAWLPVVIFLPITFGMLVRIRS